MWYRKPLLLAEKEICSQSKREVKKGRWLSAWNVTWQPSTWLVFLGASSIIILFKATSVVRAPKQHTPPRRRWGELVIRHGCLVIYASHLITIKWSKYVRMFEKLFVCSKWVKKCHLKLSLTFCCNLAFLLYAMASMLYALYILTEVFNFYSLTNRVAHRGFYTDCM